EEDVPVHRPAAPGVDARADVLHRCDRCRRLPRPGPGVHRQYDRQRRAPRDGVRRRQRPSGAPAGPCAGLLYGGGSHRGAAAAPGTRGLVGPDDHRPGRGGRGDGGARRLHGHCRRRRGRDPGKHHDVGTGPGDGNPGRHRETPEGRRDHDGCGDLHHHRACLRLEDRGRKEPLLGAPDRCHRPHPGRRRRGGRGTEDRPVGGHRPLRRPDLRRDSHRPGAVAARCPGYFGRRLPL
ncbi:MAG: Protein of unknown function DUF1275, partial [uncultured Arthrobacter sp.]